MIPVYKTGVKCFRWLLNLLVLEVVFIKSFKNQTWLLQKKISGFYRKNKG